MKTRKFFSPTSRVRFGLARADITPPPGILHRLWGAARHTQAAGVHRPLVADVMVFGPVDGTSDPPLIRAHLDWGGLSVRRYEDLVQAMGKVAGVPSDRVVLACSHTHAAGWWAEPHPTESVPGGEMIVAFYEQMKVHLLDACRRALDSVQEAVISYAPGRCSLAANRDCFDEAYGAHVCGLNPDVTADDTVWVARVATPSGGRLATLVNYACHPTTLAWENTLVSPDYPGAMREAVTRASGAPCVFVLGACGDLCPRDGYTGHTAVADRNGRQLAYAALSALEALGPPVTDFEYQGPVVSGATLGTWAHVSLTEARWTEAACFSFDTFTVDLPYKPLPDRETLAADLEKWLAAQQEADARGDTVAARDCGARAERVRRWLSRVGMLPEGDAFPFRVSVHRMGDAVWVACGGEPYSWIQVELRRRFPDLVVIITPMAGPLQTGYLLREDAYGKGLYQEEPSALAKGCLETLADAIAERIGEIVQAEGPWQSPLDGVEAVPPKRAIGRAGFHPGTLHREREAKSMKIGVVDVDTSHPQSWIPIERELGHDVVCLWDGGAVHPPAYVKKFADDQGVSEVCASLEEMVDKVDCAIIHGCDWDTHIDKARPFVAAGKGVLLDKPVAGNLRDLNQLRAWAAQGVRVTGGSSLRFCVETRDWLAQPVEERGTPHTVFCGCSVDEFNYGIHAYAMLSGIMGSGAQGVQHLGEGVQRRIRVNWADGRIGVLVVGAAKAWIPFYASVATERKAAQYIADNTHLYRALLEATLPYLAGETDEPPLPMHELIEPELCALAAMRSWRNGGEEVLLSDLSEADEGYDGGAFAVSYRKSRYPDSQ